MFAVWTEILAAFGGLAFVSLVLLLFVYLARAAARRVLDSDDGSSLDDHS